MAYAGIVDGYPVRVVFKRDLSLPGLSHKAGTETEIPLYLAIKLEELGVVEIDQSLVLSPKEVASIRYQEEKESQLVKLPGDFYPRLKLSLYLLGKRGDAKTLRLLIQEARALLIERVRKMAALMAARPDIINDGTFLEKLTPEEKAFATSLRSAVYSLVSILQ